MLPIRRAVPALILALSTPGLAQGPATISFTERGAPLSKVVPRLAQATRLHLEVSVALRKEIVCIDVRDVPVRALLDKLARVTGAVWTVGKDGMNYLGPSPSARSAQKTAEIAYRAERIASALAHAPPKRPPTKDEEGEADTSIPPALADLLRIIGASTLAAIPDDTRVVYSTRPTATQEPLGEQAFNAFAEIAKEKNAEAEELLKQIKSNGTDEQYRSMLEEMAKDQVLVAPVKLLLIIGRVDAPGEPVALHIEFRGYDAQGRTINVASAVLSQPESDAVTTSDESRLTISHETRQLAQLQRAMRITVSAGDRISSRAQTDDAPVRFQMSSALRAEATQRVLTPDQFDPLAYGDDFLLGASAAKQCQLVACVPDSLLYLHHMADEGAPTPDEVLSHLRQDSSVVVSLEGDWLTVAPRDSETAESHRVDRADLARITRELHQDKLLDLNRVIEMSTAKMQLDIDGLALEWSEMASPSAISAVGEDWPTVALFASLDDAQRSALLQRHQLDFKYLTDAQSAFVRHLIYRPEDDSYISLEHGMSAGTPPKPASFAWDEGEPDDYRSEPTEVVPNGLPKDGYIELTDSTETVICADQGGDTQIRSTNSFPMNVARFGIRAARALVPAWAPTTSFKVDKLRLGKKRALEFRIFVSRDVFRRSGIFGFDFPSNETFTLNNLPDEIKKVVDEAVERLKNRPPPPVRDNGGAPPQ